MSLSKYFANIVKDYSVRQSLIRLKYIFSNIFNHKSMSIKCTIFINIIYKIDYVKLYIINSSTISLKPSIKITWVDMQLMVIPGV